MKHLTTISLLFLPFLLLSQNEGAAAASDTLPQPEESSEEAMLEGLREGLVQLYTAEKLENEEAMLAATMNLGELYEKHFYYTKAINYFQRATGLANSLGDWEKRLAGQARIADAHFHAGNFAEAYESFQEVYEQHQMFQDYRAALGDLGHMAETALSLKDFDAAADHYLTIRQLAVTNDDMGTAVLATNNLGFVASRKGDFEEAVSHFSEAEEAVEATGLALPQNVLTNLGIAWHNIGEKERSMDYLLKAEQGAERNRPYIQHLISSLYLKTDDIYNALKFNELAIENAHRSEDMEVLSDACRVASDIYEKLFEYDKALDVYKDHLTLEDSLQRMVRQRQNDLRDLHAQLDRAENELRQNLIESELEQVTIEQLELAAQAAQLEAEKQTLETEKQGQQLALLESEKVAREANLRAAQLEADRTRQALQLATQQLLAEKQQRKIGNLTQQAQMDSLNAARQAAEQEQRIALLESAKEVARLQAEQAETLQKNLRYAAALVGLILLIVTGSYINSRRLNRRLKNQNERIEKQNEEIEAERRRAEGLLLNILPQSVADELKINGVATPKHYEAVTVLFTDFQGFTKIAASMPPGQVVEELNECFLKFDEIAERHNLEKIKTMGDAYMCAGGLPEPNQTHFLDAVRAAQEIIAFINERNERLENEGRATWPIRVGIHTGELVAGVVGKKKFAYDIWGDTVNVASRMETNSEPMHINISEATYELVKNDFHCRYRGEVEVKNKGKMGMYHVEN